MPSKYLGLAGLEVSGGFGERSWRAHVEYADTACAFYESEPQFGCAYRNSIYFDGYQYRDRSVGHAIDGDSQQLAAGFMLVNPGGDSWEFALQDADINRESANTVHSVSVDAEAFAPQTCTIGGNSQAATCGSASATRSGKTT